MSHNWFNFKEKQNCNVGFLVKGIVTVVCFSKIILLHYELVSKFTSEEYLLLLNMQIPHDITTINKNTISLSNR